MILIKHNRFADSDFDIIWARCERFEWLWKIVVTQKKLMRNMYLFKKICHNVFVGLCFWPTLWIRIRDVMLTVYALLIKH